MNPHSHSKLNQRQQEETKSPLAGTTAQQASAEFASPEEMLRHDADQTPVPATVAERLQESIRKEPRPEPSGWWRRLLGR